MPAKYNNNEEGGGEQLPKVRLPRGTAASYADLLYKTREERYKLQREAKKKEALEKTLNDYFINSLSKDSTGVAGKTARVQIESKPKPVVENWPKLYAHVKRTGEFELFQRRVNERAVTERWEQKKQVPGIGKFNVKKVSCVKL